MIAFHTLSNLYPEHRRKLQKLHFGQGMTALACDQSRTPAGSHEYWFARTRGWATCRSRVPNLHTIR